MQQQYPGQKIVELPPALTVGAEYGLWRGDGRTLTRRSGIAVMTNTRLTLRVDFGSKRSIGPGKIRLLEEIDRGGSISQAGRSLGRTLRLVDCKPLA
ncbi:MAG: hypothetical protein J2P48_11890 [Alphaproteobacteria bacterium]|nr:hypothetical protein [Alphaproteobacteria bacterium]